MAERPTQPHLERLLQAGAPVLWPTAQRAEDQRVAGRPGARLSRWWVNPAARRR